MKLKKLFSLTGEEAPISKAAAEELVAAKFEKVCELILTELGAESIEWHMDNRGASLEDVLLTGMPGWNTPVSVKKLISTASFDALLQAAEKYGESTLKRIFNTKMALGTPTRVKFT